MNERRERFGSWRVDVRRGQWFAVDGRTGRRIKSRSREHATATVEANNLRELCSVSTVPAAVVWGK